MPLIDRFWSKVRIGSADECWEWIGGKQSTGYGRFSIVRRRQLGAHQFSFYLATGHLVYRPGRRGGAGGIVMHSCDNPSCVNPSHLRLGTVRENAIDSVNKGRGYARLRGVTHCKVGHKFTPENTQWVRHGRACRACNRRRNKEWKERQRAA